jgi:hypothetical protein
VVEELKNVEAEDVAGVESWVEEPDQLYDPLGYVVEH